MDRVRAVRPAYDAQNTNASFSVPLRNDFNSVHRSSGLRAPAVCDQHFISAAAVGLVGPGRDDQRHVVVLRGIRYAEPDRHPIQKRSSLYLEVVTDVKDQLIPPGPKFVLREQRGIGTPVCIGPKGSGDLIIPYQIDPHSGGGNAAQDIEHVSGEFSHVGSPCPRGA